MKEVAHVPTALFLYEFFIAPKGFATFASRHFAALEASPPSRLCLLRPSCSSNFQMNDELRFHI
jgi:hypothetical protein